MKKLFILSLLLLAFNSFSQTKKIRIISSEFSEADEKKYPGATILIGNVKIAHEGATLDCKQALLYKKENLFKAAGEVVIEQGDSIIQYSDFAIYNGDTKKAVSWGNVEINDKEMKMNTDTLHFDRKEQVLFYQTGGTIKDKKNTLKSLKGTYFLKEKKFIAKSKVTVVNPESHLESNHLDYYTNTSLAYLYGPSTITNLKDSTKVYSERGFYDTNTEISYFVKRAKLFLKNRTIEADSLYYDKRKGFASATNRIKIIDTLQNTVTKGNYAELYEQKDSLFIIDRAVAITEQEKDSMYVHGDKILITGKPEKRIVRIFNNVKIFKSNLQGKCDSIHTSQITGLTRMFRSPILWSGKSQITGDSIHLVSDKKTNELDSLRVLQNAFIIQKDSLSDDNYNQIKGRNIYGKFIENDLRTMLVKGNAESLYYNRNDETQKLETITKEIASDIEFKLENNEVVETKYFKKSEGKTFPPSEFPKGEKKFRGFVWRGDEQPLVMEDIFIKDKASIFLKPKRNNKAVIKAKKKLKKENEKRRTLPKYDFKRE
ncbi:OstA-like protein [Tenacibaculum sp. MAR_2010_89]|uniref:OstA-like protein n=1 Tax=Tenacibaculum sp. MAR_2010_89 TaxID=1250198 RepID=UPI00089B169C|nr:OstA-like protein [Tenacibaculum sp. MAR_2010_89]SEE55349.1 OstA-like protein [Tenacibaculum sp. MAR_2010_89]